MTFVFLQIKRLAAVCFYCLPPNEEQIDLWLLDRLFGVKLQQHKYVKSGKR